MGPQCLRPRSCRSLVSEGLNFGQTSNRSKCCASGLLPVRNIYPIDFAWTTTNWVNGLWFSNSDAVNIAHPRVLVHYAPWPESSFCVGPVRAMYGVREYLELVGTWVLEPSTMSCCPACGNTYLNNFQNEDRASMSHHTGEAVPYGTVEHRTVPTVR